MEDAETRRERALGIALEVAKSLGLEARDPRVIKDSNNTIIHLAPTPVVAKVGTTILRPDVAAVLERELRVGLFLAELAAPIAPPVTHVSPGPHFEDGSVVTLWEYIESSGEPSLTGEELGDMLNTFHRAFRDYPEALPDFTANLSRAQSALDNVEMTSALSATDRAFLLEEAATLGEALIDKDIPRHPLHGDPYLDGNILPTEEGPLLVDFEAACVGPYEWDLTSLDRALFAYPSVDRKLLAVLSRMRSLTVSTWCWMQYGRAPEVDEAAHVHLNLLREESLRLSRRLL